MTDERESGDLTSSPLPTGAEAKRRSFLGALLGFGTAFVGLLLSVPLVRFALFPLFETTTSTDWSDIGAAADFSSMAAPELRQVTVERVDGWRREVSEKAVYIIRDTSGELRVLSTICPHLGCGIAWRPDEGQFVCPCHVGVFASDGALISGPPPRGMDELESRIEAGRLEVRYRYFRQLVPTREIIA